MKASDLLRVATLLLCLCAAHPDALAQETIGVANIEYLKGVPGHMQKLWGSLRIGPTEIAFVAGGKPQFTIAAKGIDYVAAQAQAAMRARTADVGVAMATIVASVSTLIFTPAGPLGLLFHKREKHLLSLEYLEGENQVRRLALFDVHDHSALAVKKMIDTRLGLTPDSYRTKDQEEEQRKREREAQRAPAGLWEATQNTTVGDSQYHRVLLEKGNYTVLIFDRYIGFKPDRWDWARYRLPLRQVNPVDPSHKTLTPIHKSGRLVGFQFDGKKYLFN